MLGDILDGYFPYDLKKKYPEGVPLKMVDKTTELYVSDIVKEQIATLERGRGVNIGGSAFRHYN